MSRSAAAVDVKRRRDATAYADTPAATAAVLDLMPAVRPQPSLRPGLVARPRLVRRLLTATDVPVVVVIAPAGYGKTTVLTEWAEQERRPVAWVGLGGRGDDAHQLVADIASALGTLEPIEPQLREALVSPLAGLALPRLARALADRQPFVLILDDVDVAEGSASQAVLRLLAGNIPSGSVLALASRTEPPLRVGGLRACRDVLELRARDLAATHGEAAAILAGAGLHLEPEHVATLLHRTEGWPAALYLAALSVRAQDDRAGAVARYRGDDRLVAEYLRDDVLSALSDDQAELLRRTAPLERLSGPLCDAVLQRRGSGQVLLDVARAGAPIWPVGAAEEEFRPHALLAEALRAELRRAEPEVERAVHHRVSTWHERHGDTAAAITHAIAAGDDAVSGALLWRVAPSYAASGRAAELRDWIARHTREAIAGCPALALTAATTSLIDGDRDGVERWTLAAERHLDAGPADLRRPLRAGALLMRAAIARGGVDRMREDAGSAAALDPGNGPLCVFAAFLTGTARGIAGDSAGARADLEAATRDSGVAMPGLQALCLAELALLALAEEEWSEGAGLADRARAQIERARLSDAPICALVYAASAFARAHRGRVAEARGDVGDARRLLTMGEVAPWHAAQTQIALARAELRLSEVAEARSLLAEAARRLRASPEAIVLHEWLGAAMDRADAFAVDATAGPASLTTAELRVMGFLPSHLSFREIALRLQVSPNTVKTHAHAVYRKLDASSRSEAVTRARKVGFLDAEEAAAGGAHPIRAMSGGAAAATLT